MQDNEVILGCSKLYKSFGITKAVQDVDFALHQGDIVGLVGENGAGKSTLIKLLAGELQPDGGNIFYQNKKVNWATPDQALKSGIGMVHQTPLLVPELSAANNIFLGQEFTQNHLVDEAMAVAEAQKLLEVYNIFPNLDLEKKVAEMSAGEKEVVEILKVLSYGPKVLILDEPTASLPRKETETLIEMLQTLNRVKNLSIIFISHKLEEVFDLCNKITVLRNGRNVGQMTDKADFKKENVVRMMIDDELSEFYPDKVAETGEQVLEVRNLASDRLKDINFEVKAGEIVGFYGLMGAGMTEVVESVFGLRSFESGSILLDGQDVAKADVREMIAKGVYLIPSDRHRFSMFDTFTIQENATVAHLSNIFKNLFLKQEKEKTYVEEKIDDIGINIRYAGLDQKMSELSGGNQQKVVVARWLLRDCKLLIANDPTMGIDIGAKRDIYFLLRELNKMGVAVIFISSEITEILGMADRIYTMYDGEITAELQGNDINQENVLINIM